MKLTNLRQIIREEIARVLSKNANLLEFEYGEFLFADPEFNEFETKKFKKFLNKWYSKEEVNTDDEHEFLYDLQSYIDEGNTDTKKLSTVLKFLKPLKSKFPGVLDPSKSTTKSKFVYRGTNIPISTISNYTPKKSKQYIEYNNPIKLKSKGTKGFISFSVDINTAIAFSEDNAFDLGVSQTLNLLKSGLVPVIIGIPITDSNLIMNPDFMNTFMSTDYESELETLYLGQSISTSKILLTKGVINTINSNIDTAPDSYKSDYSKFLKSLPVNTLTSSSYESEYNKWLNSFPVKH